MSYELGSSKDARLASAQVSSMRVGGIVMDHPRRRSNPDAGDGARSELGVEPDPPLRVEPLLRRRRLARAAFWQFDLLACINCATVESTAAPRSSKLGPLLLDLRRLNYNKSNAANASLYSTSIVAQSRGNPSLGTSVSSTCLAVASQPLPCIATGLTTGALCVHSFTATSDATLYEYSSAMEYYQLPRNHRPATAVAWHGDTVAIAYGASSTRAAVDEYGAVLWDVHSKSAPLYKCSHNAGVASLQWIAAAGSNAPWLAVGGQPRGTIQWYDVRTAGAAAPPTMAHTGAVLGMEADPLRPGYFCTYSGVGEAVKIWDARRMESPFCEVKIHAGTKPTLATISAVQWSHVEPGLLSILSGDDLLYIYETSLARPVLSAAIRTPKPIVSFANYPYTSMPHSSEGNGATSSSVTQEVKQRVVASLFMKDVVAVDLDQNVLVLPAHRHAPIQISPRNGHIVHTLGPTLWLESEGPGAMESAEDISPQDDISKIMLRRASCLHAEKYSMDIASNIELLSKEFSQLHGTPAGASTEQLLRLWRWIQLAEAFCNADGSFDELPIWPAKGLPEAGVLKLLDLDKGKPEQSTLSETLSCPTYDSPGRRYVSVQPTSRIIFHTKSNALCSCCFRAALASCGWAGMFDLGSVMADCESQGEFERSAALAVWHGDIGAAVDALERGAAVHATTERNLNLSIKYAETLELVSFSIAGYQGGDASATTKSSVWRKSCSKLLQRPDLSDAFIMPAGAGYLRHILKFLMTIGIDDSHKDVMSDSTLSLCDRVAFACRFLSNADLMSFLEKCLKECQATGNVEGIAIAGVNMNGLQILQSYMDFTADVQTAALVTSRVVLPVEWVAERRVVAEWLHSYRFLLNRWQMWQSRAMFDVDRASLLRQVKMRQQTERGKPPGRTRPLPRLRSVDSDVQATVPAQLDARCNYCSAPLGLRRQDNQPNQWLSKMKNVVPCCPRCRKPLPRCAICMLTLGALNPYYELTKDRPREAGSNATDDLSTVANLPFAEWFSWCFRCKHGGHAHHLVGWFAKHETCPVSGCNCRCQFDGIRKLPRTGRNTASDMETQNHPRDIAETPRSWTNKS
jgi:WD repeat-containing protein mio